MAGIQHPLDMMHSEVRQLTQVRDLERRVSAVERLAGQYEIYTEDLSEVNPGANGTAAVMDSPPILITEPKFIECLGHLEARLTYNSENERPAWALAVMDTGVPTGMSVTGQVFAVNAPGIFRYERAWTTPDAVWGTPSPQNAGGWSTFWIPNPATIYVRLIVYGVGQSLASYTNRRLWVRY